MGKTAKTLDRRWEYGTVYRISSYAHVVLILLLGILALVVAVQIARNTYTQAEQTRLTETASTFQEARRATGRLVESIHTNQQLFESLNLLATGSMETYLRYRLDNFELPTGIPPLLEWYNSFNGDWSLASVTYRHREGRRVVALSRNAVSFPEDAFDSRGVVADYLAPAVEEHEGRLLFRFASRITDPFALDAVATVEAVWDKGVVLEQERGIFRSLYHERTLAAGRRFSGNRPWLVLEQVLDDGWRMRTEFSLGYLLRTLFQVQAFVIAVIIVLILVVLILSQRISSSFAAGIHRIHEAFRTLEGGNLDSRIDSRGLSGELYDVGASFNHMCDQLATYIDRVYAAEVREKRAELDALQARINPHFLNNTLEVIRMKAVSERSPVTAEMVFSLSRFFRYMLYSGRAVSLGHEIDTCVNYLKLVQHRFSDQIAVVVEVPAELKTRSVLRLCVQPFVENYVIHGLKRSDPDNRIELRGRVDVDHFVLTIADNGQGIPSEKVRHLNEAIADGRPTGSSTGIVNVAMRMKLAYGVERPVCIASDPGNGTTVTLTFPYDAVGPDESG